MHPGQVRWGLVRHWSYKCENLCLAPWHPSKGLVRLPQTYNPTTGEVHRYPSWGLLSSQPSQGIEFQVQEQSLPQKNMMESNRGDILFTSSLYMHMYSTYMYLYTDTCIYTNRYIQKTCVCMYVYLKQKLK